MGYYSDRSARLEYMFCFLGEIMVLCFGYFDSLAESTGGKLLTVFTLMVFEYARSVFAGSKDNYMIFDDDGITINRYGKTPHAFIGWDRICYGYEWTSFNFKGRYLILSEKEIPEKMRNRIIDWNKRNIEIGIVIDIGVDAEGEEIKQFIQKKLSRIVFKKKKRWYEYNYDRNMKKID